MRFRCNIVCLTVVVLFPSFFSQALFGQVVDCGISWDPIQQLTSGTDQVPSHLPQIAVSGDTIHIIWYDQDFLGTESNDGVRYCHSYDGGITFSLPVTVSSFDTALNQPWITCSGENVYIGFLGIIDTFYGAVLVRSTDAGSTWLSPQRLQKFGLPLIVEAYNNNVIILYQNLIVPDRNGILLSTDAGSTWSIKSANAPHLNAMAVSSDKVHGVITTSSPPQDVYYYFSTNLGGFWSFGEVLSREDFTSSQQPVIATNGGGDVYGVWNDNGTLMMRRSRKNGLAWLPEVRVSEINTATFADVAASEEFVAVVWESKPDTLGNKTLNIRPSNDFGFTFCSTDVPTTSSLVGEPAIKISGTSLHVVWFETINGNDEIMYRHGTLTKNPRIGGKPTQFALKQNYPNPFNGYTHINYDVPIQSHVTLTIYDVLGQQVARLVNTELLPGRYDAVFSGSNVSSGVYFYTLQTSTFIETKKLLIIR